MTVHLLRWDGRRYQLETKIEQQGSVGQETKLPVENIPIFIYYSRYEINRACELNVMDQFFDESSKSIMIANNLHCHEDFWNLKTEWFEAPNRRRNGWSGVIRLQLENDLDIFIKRQENHNTRTLMNPISGVPTFRRELRNIQLFRKNNIPTLEPLFFSERKIAGKHQAILITRALNKHMNLEVAYDADPELTRKEYLPELARIVRSMHDQGLAHYCLYPTHVFVPFEGEMSDIRLIDLEKARQHPFPASRRIHDLECFIRRANRFVRADLELFMKHYFAGDSFTRVATVRKQINQILEKR